MAALGMACFFLRHMVALVLNGLRENTQSWVRKLPHQTGDIKI